MAVSHIQPLLLLLVSLFFLPALVRSSDKFFPCKGSENFPVKVNSLDISINEDVTRTFKLAGYTSQYLKPDEVIVYAYNHVGTFSSIKKEYPLCDVTACPVTPGPVTFTFTGVISEEEKEEGELMSDIYEIGIEYKKTKWMCIRFPVNAASESSW